MSSRRVTRSIVLGSFLLALPASTLAAGQGTASPLAAVTGLKCHFPAMATGTWGKDGSATTATKEADLTLVYEEIDTQGGTAEVQLQGYSRNLYIVVRFVAGTLHLLAVDSGGPVYITTVFNSESRAGRFKAAHTRHEFTPVSLPGFTSRPEQYVGDCEIIQ